MRFVLSLIIALLLTTQTWAQEPRIISLANLLLPRERQFIDNAFPTIDADAVIFVETGWDGPGGICAFVEIIEETPSLIIWLDRDDWGWIRLDAGVFQRQPVFCLSVLHELIHVDQTLRGIEYRRRMIAECERPYYSRFFEREAYAVSRILLSKWPVLW